MEHSNPDGVRDDAALQLRREHHRQPDDVDTVNVYLHTEPHFLCTPLELRRQPPAKVEIITRDARTLSAQVVYAKGHPDNLMTWEELKDKFRDCTTHAAAPLSAAHVEKAVAMCAELELNDGNGGQRTHVPYKGIGAAYPDLQNATLKLLTDAVGLMCSRLSRVGRLRWPCLVRTGT